ncbi:MAG: sensor domain-containing diguanylate cyclase [Elusimicrobia bacterium]|nr:sensor domain-containing diguanylate cyclase [Elusimicrobiota bacterium]
MSTVPEIKHWPVGDLVRSIVVPIISFILFFVWIYVLVESPLPKILIFPSISIVIVLFYFFSGYVFAGILLCFISIVAVLAQFITPYELSRMLFIVQAVVLWSIFLCIDRYRIFGKNQFDHSAEEIEELESKIAFMENSAMETRHACDDFKQRISNYQLLGRMIEKFGVSLNKEKIIALVVEMAEKIIRRGEWTVIQGVQKDIFARWIKDHGIPLVIANIAYDSRFYVQQSVGASLVALPLNVDGHYWGILKGTAEEADVFSENDVRLLSLLGGIASQMLSNSRLYQISLDLAITDELTGLFVQSYFKERLHGEILRSKNSLFSLSAAIIDVDNFKTFNDTYGHAGGDVVLRHIAVLIRERLRETDFVCRYGGEEFAVIMVQTCRDDAIAIIEKVRHAVEIEQFFLPMEGFKPEFVNITVSAGVAVLSDAINGAEDLIGAADAALYRAKANGRNRVEIYE